MDGITYTLLLKSGEIVGPISRTCISFLIEHYGSVDGYIDYMNTSKIIIGPPGNFKYPFPRKTRKFLEILKGSVFGEIISKYSIYNRNKPVVKFNPATSDVSSILIATQLIRLIWEFPQIMDRILAWDKAGYDYNTSLFLGHYIDIENYNYDVSYNYNHVLFQKEVGLRGLIRNWGKVVDISLSRNIWVSEKNNYHLRTSAILNSVINGQNTGHSIEYYLIRNSDPGASTWYKISPESIQRICDDIKA